MKCDLSLCTTFATILFTFTLPIEVGSDNNCIYSQYDIILLMDRDPDYQRNPCYIQWKADQDAKMQVWSRTDRPEIKPFRVNQIEYENRQRERKREQERERENENRQNSYSNTHSSPKIETARSSTWKVLGVILGVIVGICCCAACIALVQNENDSTPLPTTNTTGLTVFSTTSITTNSNNNANRIALEEQEPSSQVSNTQSPEQANPQHRAEPNVPLLPQSLMNRQNSLPSYDDAMRIPSAPPKE